MECFQKFSNFMNSARIVRRDFTGSMYTDSILIKLLPIHLQAIVSHTNSMDGKQDCLVITTVGGLF